MISHALRFLTKVSPVSKSLFFYTPIFIPLSKSLFFYNPIFIVIFLFYVILILENFFYLFFYCLVIYVALVSCHSPFLLLFVCCMFCVICYLEHGHWVCGESWLAVKDSLTHHPSSQGWAPRVLLLCCCVLCCVVCYCVLRCGDGGGYFFLFLFL